MPLQIQQTAVSVLDITDYKSIELLSELLCSDLKFMRNFNKIHLHFKSFESDTQKCTQTENVTAPNLLS
jgi:hypothetical protein